MYNLWRACSERVILCKKSGTGTRLKFKPGQVLANLDNLPVLCAGECTELVPQGKKEGWCVVLVFHEAILLKSRF